VGKKDRDCAGVHTSATFLWNSASIWARYSAISRSASSFACLSLADLAIEHKKHSCSYENIKRKEGGLKGVGFLASY
jgi:hypothetical protein